MSGPGEQNETTKTAQSNNCTAAKSTLTVRDCLVWRSDNNSLEDKPQTSHLPPTKYERTRQTRPETELSQIMLRSEEEGRVSDALQGWPRHMRLLAKKERENASRKQQKTDAMAASTITKKTKAGKDARRTKTEEPADTGMSDLLSQKYLEEQVMKHQREEQKKNNAERAKQQHLTDAHSKPNKTVQLRSIAVNSKLNRAESQLWKMPKFTSKAQARVGSNAAKQHAQNNVHTTTKNRGPERRQQRHICHNYNNDIQQTFERMVVNDDGDEQTD